MRLKKIGIIIANLFCVFTFYINVHALPGDLDSTFDSDGKVTTSIAGSGGNDQGNDVAIQPDGKIVVAGYTNIPGSGTGPDMVLIRYNADGSLDTGFGTGGKVLFLESGQQISNCLVIQPDGKILAVGNADNSSGRWNLAVYRFNTDGSLDTTFGTGGKVIQDIQNYSEGNDAVLQPDGKIVIAGTTSISQNPQFCVVRLNTNGTLDTSFNTTGYYLNNSGEEATAVALQSDGKIIAAGKSSSSGMWVRFSSDGIAETPLNNLNITIEDVAIQTDGKIVFAGTVNTPGPITSLTQMAITRYNPDKTLDRTFGNFGLNYVIFPTVTNVVQGGAMALAIQPDGRILVGGFANSNTVNFGIVRFNRNGFLDVGFGASGKVITPFFASSEEIRSLVLQPDGKVVAAGYAFSETPNNIVFAVARYDAGDSNTLPNRTPFDYDGDGRSDVSVFRPSTNVWYHLFSFNSSVGIKQFGTSGDIPVPADYDGDGRTEIGIYRPSARQWWYLSTSDNIIYSTSQAEGVAGSIPRPSDHTGDGKADLVIYNPANSVWSRRVTSSTSVNITFGIAEDQPLVGDFDGDGKGDLAVFRPSVGDWWYRSSINGQFVTVHWGATGDIPVPGDYDGDGKTDFVVFRPSDGGWYILYSTGSYTIATFGTVGDKPIAADYDGDGKTDIAVWRPSTGTWYLLQTTSGFGALQWGMAGDIPTENAFLP